MPSVSRCVVATILSVALISATAQAAQDTSPAASPSIVSEASLEHIRQALAEEHRLVITAALTPTFYAQADATLPTFSNYLKGWVPPGGPSRGGIDLLQLVRDGIRNLQQAQREREARQIRVRIDRELETFYGVK